MPLGDYTYLSEPQLTHLLNRNRSSSQNECLDPACEVFSAQELIVLTTSQGNSRRKSQGEQKLRSVRGPPFALEGGLYMPWICCLAQDSAGLGKLAGAA